MQGGVLRSAGFGLAAPAESAPAPGEHPMRSSAFSMFGAAALGFALAGAVFSTWAPRPARADSHGSNGLGAPLPTTPVNLSGGQVMPSQPLAVQALDPEHFVVVSREPRLLTRDGK